MFFISWGHEKSDFAQKLNQMKIKSFLLIILVSTLQTSYSQNSSQSTEKDTKSNFFGQIYTDFYYCFNNDYTPQAAFRFNQGIMGYKHTFSGKLSAIIMFDVTRTTHIMEITDTAGNPLNYSYFEGSKYTAYLKMAEIKWSINEYLTLRVGQLLNTQYLTVQDKFWGYRYVEVTMQEKFFLGMPADFGAQLDFKYKDKFLNQFSVVNGEGPFRHQDNNGKFLYSDNIQYTPTENIILKMYADYAPNGDTSSAKKDKYTTALFAGYKTKGFRIGAEYSKVFNYKFDNGTDYAGISVFGSAKISEKINLLGRYDHIELTDISGTVKTDYYIAGVQYTAADYLNMSLNFRYYSKKELPFVFMSFGIKF